MKQSISLDRFISFLREHQIDIDAGQRRQLENYLDLILHWSKKQNLVSKHDLQYIVERHFLPSVFLCNVLGEYNRVSVLDVGSGAGFPGILLHIIRPDFDIFLIDSSKKKYLFLCEVLDNLNLSGEAIAGRVELFARHADRTFDIIVSRALTSPERLWSWTEPLSGPETRIFLIKGADAASETDEIDNEDIKIRIIKPDREWINFSPNLESKSIVIMEKNNVGKYCI